MDANALCKSWLLAHQAGHLSLLILYPFVSSFQCHVSLSLWAVALDLFFFCFSVSLSLSITRHCVCVCDCVCLVCLAQPENDVNFNSNSNKYFFTNAAARLHRGANHNSFKSHSQESASAETNTGEKREHHRVAIANKLASSEEFVHCVFQTRVGVNNIQAKFHTFLCGLADSTDKDPCQLTNWSREQEHRHDRESR